MSLIAFIININISFITSLELESLAKLFHLIFIIERAFNEVLSLINVVDTPFS